MAVMQARALLRCAVCSLFTCGPIRVIERRASLILCGCGGTGRRRGLKIPRAQALVGSSPTTRTTLSISSLTSVRSGAMSAPSACIKRSRPSLSSCSVGALMSSPACGGGVRRFKFGPPHRTTLSLSSSPSGLSGAMTTPSRGRNRSRPSLGVARVGRRGACHARGRWPRNGQREQVRDWSARPSQSAYGFVGSALPFEFTM